MKTLLITIVLPSIEVPPLTDKPLVTLVWPGGQTERFRLSEHDWGHDDWDWRNGHLPTSLTKRLREMHYAPSTIVHGTRTVYVSPQNVGIASNEQGRLMVYELQYED